MAVMHTQEFLEPSHIQAIELIASEWSLVEAVLSVNMWQTAGVNWENGHIFTDDLPSSARIHMFNALSLERWEENESARQEIGNLYTELKRLNTERNTVIHHFWDHNFSTDTIHAQKFTARGGKFNPKPLEKTVDELIMLVSQIGKLADDLDDFRRKHLGEFSPLTPKQTQRGRAEF